LANFRHVSTPKLISARAVIPQDRRLGILKKVAYYRESEKRMPAFMLKIRKGFTILLFFNQLTNKKSTNHVLFNKLLSFI